MKDKPLLLLLAPLLFAACHATRGPFETSTASFEVNGSGALAAIRYGGRNLVAPGQLSPLLQVHTGGQWLLPTKAVWDASKAQFTLSYGSSGITASVKTEAKESHLALELVSISPGGKVDLIQWGPYPTTVGSIVGEVLGVARSPEIAVGIQALNPKTLGGIPAEDGSDIFWGQRDDPGHYPNLNPALLKDQSYRGNTAWPMPFGSVLRAYCRDRRRDRIIANWEQQKYVAPAFDDGGVVGSRIALFASPAAQALETIGKIEVAEGLPHPMLGGTWAKMSPRSNASYLIVDFGENDIVKAVSFARRAGLDCVYHSDPFNSWGHFTLRPKQFPHGWNGLKTCADMARKEGVSIGVHTLSNFITTTDAYVTPKPDPRLAKVGASTLAEDVPADAVEITIEAPDFFKKETCLNTVNIGEELVQYKSVSATAPWKLMACRRGAFGTRVSSHKRGDAIAKLADHAYKTFLTDMNLTLEVARKIAELCDFAGIRRISMDGLEGCFSTGHGDYGRSLFAKTWYDALSPELRGRVFNDESNPGHFNWHINSYYNWGEPWYAGFRESQTLYRFKNQVFYERNLLPHMLGWFSLRASTTLADVEWMLARAAGYNAGFALATNAAFVGSQTEKGKESTPQARQLGEILDAIREWENARLSGAFPEAIKTLLRDNTREFHLEGAGRGEWILYPLDAGKRSAGVRVKATVGSQIP
jgi:hypothetical protein